MGLAEGCRGQRYRVDEREGTLERHTQLGFGEHPDLRERHSGNLILKPLELFGDLGRQHIEPG